ncbi:MurR/RpiR family transcriptional regulator [Cronobacter sakazakii]|uniref:MurR/RpiR family transcriptional regulator n=1 Tax=Cronobacter sakazakii TaxID=28141 RepID=UPI002894DB17|nr:MurR/RpiR family transcriptional regulator [Cronobacter sakazakii]MDT3641070.1 MurR/RpiR family transcriptional regulator [Cronobacter sakazakii]
MSVNKEKVRVYIANILSSLGETDRKIAEFMINQPAKVVQLPVKKLAQELVVSEATIVRFAKKIGYGGLLKLKAALKRELLDDSDLSLPSSPDIFLDDSRNDVAQKLALTIDTTVKETIDLLDMQKIRQLVERFIAARRVMFVGFVHRACRRWRRGIK